MEINELNNQLNQLLIECICGAIGKLLVNKRSYHGSKVQGSMGTLFLFGKLIALRRNREIGGSRLTKGTFFL